MRVTKKIRVGVLGPGQAAAEELAAAEEVGAEIAKRGAILVCGGLGGVMEAAARGAKKHGGLTVGILPGTSAAEANQFVDVPIVTGMGEARNALVVRSADVVIAIAGSYGTLSEIALALKMEIPVVGLGTWELKAPDGTPVPINVAKSAQHAVEMAWKLAGK